MDVRERDCIAQPTNGSFGPWEKFCPRVFDGYLCWLATEAGALAVQPCPHAQLDDAIVATSLHASKHCTADGSWYEQLTPDGVVAWTNYSDCGLRFYSNDTAIVDINVHLDRHFLQLYRAWMPATKWITYHGYWISLFTLLVCVLILLSIKKLHCARNTLHVHLFLSFILRAIAFLFKSVLLVDGLAMSSDLVTNSEGRPHYITEHFNWMCKLITSTWFYFTQANFMFILMEGIYLHNLMFRNLFSEKSSMRLYYLCGWGIPFGFITLWAILRMVYDDKMCWTTTSNAYIAWLTQLPVDISILINFGLFLSITRVLCVKIQSMYVQRNKLKYRRLLRSTLTLMLIYAVPYALSVLFLSVVTHYRQTVVELVWICYDQIFSAFQGLFMGMIYCILNGEVRTELRKIVRSLRDAYPMATTRDRRAVRTISNTVQFTIPMPIKEDVAANQQLRRAAASCAHFKSTENL